MEKNDDELDSFSSLNTNDIKNYINTNKTITTKSTNSGSSINSDNNTITTWSSSSLNNMSHKSELSSILSNDVNSILSNDVNSIVSNDVNSIVSNDLNSRALSDLNRIIIRDINNNINNINNDNMTNTTSKNSVKKTIISNNNNNINKFARSIDKKIMIDVAVLCQEYTTIEKMCDDHIINLDEIEITKDTFQNIFYPYCENFGINKNNIQSNSFYTQYISFLPEHRTVNKKKFYLLEEIISNIENDLNISRNCFTVESLVELTNEIISISSFCDINCCSVLASLTWNNILEIIENYTIINENCGCNYSDNKTPVIPICVISIIFKTPTPGVKNTLVRFNYKIVDL
jgi:hypothetical protein